MPNQKNQGQPTNVQLRSKGRRILRWVQRILVGIVLLVILVVGMAAGWQWLASSLDKRAYPPVGELVDVGGYQLHLVCLGGEDAAASSPTVILDALGDGTFAHWGWVQPVVAQRTRVCAYDRAGRGWSDASPLPRDGKSLAAELHALLTNAGIDGPKILVGHSFGGLIARIYADLYPEEVAGMVLIDPGIPAIRSERMPSAAHAQAAADADFMDAAPMMARLGIFRMVGYGAPLPQPQQSYAQAFYASNELWDSLLGEAQALAQTDAQAAATGTLGDRPLLILAATRGWIDPNAATDESRQVYNQLLQEELLPLSTASVYREIEGASHASLVTNEADAAHVSAGIVEVVEAVRSGGILSR